MMSLRALDPKTQVLRGGAGAGFGRVKRGRSENKETYIDSFPGKLCTAMLGEGGRGGCGSRRREVQGRERGRWQRQKKKEIERGTFL